MIGDCDGDESDGDDVVVVVIVMGMRVMIMMFVMFIIIMNLKKDRQSWPKLCGTSLQNALPRPSISFSHGNKRSLGQILPSPPSPHTMLFVRKGLPTSRPTLHRGEGGSERILQQFGKKALCPTHFGQDCMLAVEFCFWSSVFLALHWVQCYLSDVTFQESQERPAGARCAHR